MNPTSARCDLCGGAIHAIAIWSLIREAFREVEALHLVNPPMRSPRSPLHPVPSVRPGWVVPHPSRDSAARLAFQLAVDSNEAENAAATRARQRGLLTPRRKPSELPGVGYLVVGESALHATLRLLLVPAELDRHRCWCGELAEEDFPRLTRAAGKLAGTRLVLLQGTLPREGLQQAIEELVASHELNYLIVDDAAALARQQMWTELSRAAMNCGVILLEPDAAAEV